MIINRDLNIDQNNRDYHFGHNRGALVRTKKLIYGKGDLCMEFPYNI